MEASTRVQHVPNQVQSVTLREGESINLSTGVVTQRERLTPLCIPCQEGIDANDLQTLSGHLYRHESPSKIDWVVTHSDRNRRGLRNNYLVVLQLMIERDPSIPRP